MDDPHKDFTGPTLDEIRAQAVAETELATRYGEWVMTETVLSDGRPVVKAFEAPTLERAKFIAESYRHGGKQLSLTTRSTPQDAAIVLAAAGTEAAKALALAQLPSGSAIGEIDTVTAGRKGLLGIGAKLAQFKVNYRTPAVVELTYRVAPKIRMSCRPNVENGFITLESIKGVWTLAVNWPLPDDPQSALGIFVGKNISLLEPIQKDKRFFERILAMKHLNFASELAAKIVVENFRRNLLERTSYQYDQCDFLHQESWSDSRHVHIFTAVSGIGKTHTVHGEFSLVKSVNWQ